MCRTFRYLAFLLIVGLYFPSPLLLTALAVEFNLSDDRPTTNDELYSYGLPEFGSISLSLNDKDNNEFVLLDPLDRYWTQPAKATLILQPAPAPREAQPSEILPSITLPSQAAARLPESLFGSPGLVARTTASRSGTSYLDIVLGSESKGRLASDVANLLGKSPHLTGLQTQQRTPVVSDPRLRGMRLGQLLASGSYWVPARQDLDTMLSKIDSHIIDDVVITKGPYNVRHGPGFNFIDVQLLASPRFEDGFESHGRSSLEYKANSDGWYGRQTFWGGAEDWGFRIGYGDRNAGDYETGGGFDLPTGYNSRDFDFALGTDLSENSHLEFSYLRLDQTDLEFPGVVYDINFLTTDAFELEYTLTDQPAFDQLYLSGWYNATRFAGDTNNPTKTVVPAIEAGIEQQFSLDPGAVDFSANTEADVLSAGSSILVSYGAEDCLQLTVGADVRYVKQGITETRQTIIEVSPMNFVTSTANANLPKATITNPGALADISLPITEAWTATLGARVDWVQTDVDVSKVKNLGSQLPANNLLRGEDTLYSFYWMNDLTLSDSWTAKFGFGHAQRPPTLTERYADGLFMGVIQSGFNTVVGNPFLADERAWQIDGSLRYQDECFQAGVRLYHTWILDYITYDGVLVVPGQLENARSLSSINTDLATLKGIEFDSEMKLSPFMSVFANLAFVRGQDEEIDAPLPEIFPFASYLGVRLHDGETPGRWGIEMTGRFVGRQDRLGAVHLLGGSSALVLEEATAGFTVWDVRTFLQATDQLLLTAGIENFTDKLYQEHLDYRTGLGVVQQGANFYFRYELVY